MKDLAHRRHGLSDRAWEVLEPLLPGRKGSWGGKAKDNRLFLNAVFWIVRTGAPWRDLPPDYGNWKNTHRRFCRCRGKDIWEQLLELLIYEPDMEWLMVDATYIKVHPQAAGAVGGNQVMGRAKGGSLQKHTCPWMHVVYRSELLLHRMPSLIARNLGTLSRRSRRNPHR